MQYEAAGDILKNLTKKIKSGEDQKNELSGIKDQIQKEEEEAEETENEKTLTSKKWGRSDSLPMSLHLPHFQKDLRQRKMLSWIFLRRSCCYCYHFEPDSLLRNVFDKRTSFSAPFLSF